MDTQPLNPAPAPDGPKRGDNASVKAATISAGAAIIGGLLASPVIVTLLNKSAPPPTPTALTAPTPAQDQMPAFSPAYTYKPRAIQRVEFEPVPGTALTKRAKNFLRLTEVSFNAAGDTFKLELTARNNESTPIMVDPQPDYFALADDHDQKATLLGMYRAGRELLGSGQERKIVLLYTASGWYGKTTAAHDIYFRVAGFDPIQRETWRVKTVPLAS